MVFCVCNNLRSACVREAIAAGACRPGDVHRHHGVRVDCGRCLPFIDDEMRLAAVSPAEQAPA